MNQNQQQYLRQAVEVLKEHGMSVNVNNISHFVNGAIPANIIREWLDEQAMQALDKQLDPDGLDKSGQEAWKEYQAEEGKPAEAEGPCTGCENGCDECLEGKEPVYDEEPDEYLFREDYPNVPRWPDTGRSKDRTFGNAINPIQWNWW